MSTKQLKPSTPGQRHRIAPIFDEITTDKPLKALSVGIHQSGGRNRLGRMTMRHRGGGHKRKYRIIDFRRNKLDIPAKVQTIEYDPNRTARIALLAYADGEKRYIIAPNNLKVGDAVISSENAQPVVGNAMPMKNMPIGTFIHNIELSLSKVGQGCRSVVTVAKMVAKTAKSVIGRLPSGEVRIILTTCFGTVGRTSNPDHFSTQKGKAGRNRWLGRRPSVRGVAMILVDHPMGGGEGKASGGHPRSPWGQSEIGRASCRERV